MLDFLLMVAELNVCQSWTISKDKSSQLYRIEIVTIVPGDELPTTFCGEATELGLAYLDLVAKYESTLAQREVTA